MDIGVIIVDIIDVWDCGNNGYWDIIAEIMDMLGIIITEVIDVGHNHYESNGCWE
ncbi:hypothetical protein Glove_443g82 [Diversispora epigaea]|uniref:Uncharacterized protein n=1 Tax=Diversispora epigaea TaxID=1348612 RepID=A0A397GV66_9GLOM|nr:hypothetical protein Glove_443g82 [Diversispora epigaea]